MPAVIYKFDGDTADLERALHDVRAVATDTGQDTNRAMREGAKGADSLEASAKKAAKTIGVGLLASIAAATAATVGLVNATLDYAKRAGDIQDAAKRIGASARDYQLLTSAFKQSGIEASQTEDAIKKLNVGLGDASRGSGQAGKALEALGLTLEDVEKLPLPERVALLADRIDGLGSQSAKSSVAVDLFGRSGVDLIPAFEGGGEAIRAAVAEIEKAGTISNEAAAAADRMGDAWDILKMSIGATRDEMLSGVVPALDVLIQAATKAIQTFRQTGDVERFGQVFGEVMLDVVGPAMAITANVILRSLAALKPAFLGVRAALDTWVETSLLVTGRWDDMIAHIDQSNGTLVELKQSLRELGAEQENIDAATEAFLTTLDGLRRKMGSAGDASHSTAANLREVAEAAGEARKETESLGEWLDKASVGTSIAPSGGGADAPSTSGGGADPLAGLLDSTNSIVGAFDETFTSIEDRFQEFKDTWQSGLGDVVNAVGVATSMMFEAFSDLARDSMNERIDAARETDDEIASIDRKLKNTLDGNERAHLMSVKRRLQERSEKEKEAALKAFRVQKALALVSAGINTALAIINAFATAPTIIAGVALAVVAGAAGAIAIAKIAAEKPPSFHRGGMLRASSVAGASRDRVPIVGKPGEAVLNTQGVAAAGGPGGVDALNRGNGAAGGATYNIIRLGTKTTEAIAHQQLRSNSGRMADAFRTVRPRVGRHVPSRL